MRGRTSLFRDDAIRRRVIETFRRHGIDSGVSVALPLTEDEIVFVVSTGPAVFLSEAPLIGALMDILDRKVWVVKDAPIWEGRLAPLEFD